jgi:hypothetical protein
MYPHSAQQYKNRKKKYPSVLKEKVHVKAKADTGVISEQANGC